MLHRDRGKFYFQGRRAMPATGWKQLLADAPTFLGAGRYPIAAYSEFVPPPLLACKPYRFANPWPPPPDGCHWHVSAYEETLELQPGLEHIAGAIVTSLSHFGRGQTAH